MKLRIANLSSLFVVGAMLLSLAAGCARNPNSPLVDPADESPAPSATATPAATASATPAPTPSSNPVVVPTVPGELTIKDPVITITGMMFTRRVKAAVEVTNPTAGTLSGTVTCTFGDGSDADQVSSQNVTLNAKEVRVLNFEEKAWFDKTAKAVVTTLQPAAANRLSNRVY